ncbi:hypothetical protein D3C86_2127630 [compost metagenome]
MPAIEPLTNHNPNVGAGLLAKVAHYSISMLADTPLSRASPLPQGIDGDAQIVGTKKHPAGCFFFSWATY